MKTGLIDRISTVVLIVCCTICCTLWWAAWANTSAANSAAEQKRREINQRSEEAIRRSQAVLEYFGEDVP